MISKIDPIEHVRKRSSLYLEHDEFIPETVASKVAADALTLGAREVWLRHYGTWWLIGSRDDWFDDNTSVERPFREIVGLPSGYENSFRREILLTAFADNVFVKKGENVFVIKGNLPEGVNWLNTLPEDHRIVAFDLHN